MITHKFLQDVTFAALSLQNSRNKITGAVWWPIRALREFFISFLVFLVFFSFYFSVSFFKFYFIYLVLFSNRNYFSKN